MAEKTSSLLPAMKPHDRTDLRKIGGGALGLALIAACFAYVRLFAPEEQQLANKTSPHISSNIEILRPPVVLQGSALSEYGHRMAFMAESILAVEDEYSTDRQDSPSLLTSAEPMDWVVGLASLAGHGRLDPESDFSSYPPEILLAALDLSAAQYGESAARALRAQWEADWGGSLTAAETAYNLLLEARLPYGGGSAALEDMIGANEPAAIVVGLHEFAVDSRLAGSVRSEALIRLRDYVDPDAYREHVRDCAELAQEFGGDWAPRAQRLQAWTEAAIDHAFLEHALAEIAPGSVEDLALLIRSGLRSGRLALDDDTAGFLQSALADMDETALSGPDQLARRRLLREIAAAQSP